MQVGSQTPIYAIKQEQEVLRERNEQQRRRVDDVLTERLQLEQKAKGVGTERCTPGLVAQPCMVVSWHAICREVLTIGYACAPVCLCHILQVEVKIAEMQQAMENRLNSMPPSQRQQYQDLITEQQTLVGESKRFEDAIEELDKTLATNEGELARNPLKQRSLQLQEQVCCAHCSVHVVVRIAAQSCLVS